MDWDDADVRAIVQLVDATAFDELTIETDRFSLRLLRGADGAPWTRESLTIGEVREIAAAGAPNPAAPLADAAAPTSEAAKDGGSARWVAVKTPLPGTFYRSPKPGAPPFVEVGSHVTEGTVVAIIETMKLMNSVYAGVSGRIAGILSADGSIVAQGAVIMQIEASGTMDGS